MYTLDFEQILKWITYSQYLYLSYKPSFYSDDRSILNFNVPADKETFLALRYMYGQKTVLSVDGFCFILFSKHSFLIDDQIRTQCT